MYADFKQVDNFGHRALLTSAVQRGRHFYIIIDSQLWMFTNHFWKRKELESSICLLFLSSFVL